MEEDYAIKAVFIGLSVFIIMIVLSLIIAYYSAAKGIAKQAQLKMDIPESFDAIIKRQNQIEDKISGAELQSLIRKYAADPDVTINIVSVSNDDSAENKQWAINRSSKWYDRSLGIVKETQLSTINPSWVVLVEKEEIGNKITLNVHLNYTIDVL